MDTGIKEVREIIKQKWLAKKKKDEEERLAKEKKQEKMKRKAYLHSKYGNLLEFNIIIRSGFRISNYAKRHFLVKCKNDISKINPLYLIRIKFTNKHLKKPELKNKKESNSNNSINSLTPTIVNNEIKKEEERLMEHALKESMEQIPKDLIYDSYHTEYIDPETDPEMYLAMLASQGILEDKPSKNEQSENENLEKSKDIPVEEFSFYLGFDLNMLIKNPYQTITFEGRKLYLQKEDILRVECNYNKVDITNHQGERFIQNLRYYKSYVKDCSKLGVFKFPMY